MPRCRGLRAIIFVLFGGWLGTYRLVLLCRDRNGPAVTSFRRAKDWTPRITQRANVIADTAHGSAAMAEITKLSVGQAIDKLRGTDAPKAKMARLDEKIDVLDEETQRLRAMRRRIERDQRAGSTGRDAQKANARHVTKPKILGIIIGIVLVIIILAWTWGLL